MEALAVFVAILLAGVAAFQLALAMGTPWGEHAYGGRAETDGGRLSPTYRAMSAAAIPVLLFSAAIVLSRADVVSWLGDWVRTAVWLVFAYLVLNTAANLASSSRIERFVMGSVTAVSAVATLIVALSS